MLQSTTRYTVDLLSTFISESIDHVVLLVSSITDHVDVSSVAHSSLLCTF